MRYHSIYKTRFFAFQKESNANSTLQLTLHQSLAWHVITYTRHVCLLFKKRAMPNGIYNEHHIIVWHDMEETNLIKKRLKCVVITDAVTTIKKEKYF